MNIYQTINKIMEEVPAIGKTKQNTKQNYKFRGIDDVMNKLQPIFAKYKLFIVPELIEQTREERRSSSGGSLLFSICKMKYIFYAEDGTHVDAIVVGEGMDSGDKASNKAMAVALKYALFQVFCIPTEEMKDPDGSKPPKTISESEVIKMLTNFEELIIATDTPRENIYKYFGVNNNSEMNPEQLKEAITILKAKPKVITKEVF